jgi:hypothetical protein
LLGVVVLSIIIAIPTSMAITSGNFSISKKTNNVTIKGSSGAKRAIAYVKKKIPLNSVSMPLDNNSKWANGHSNIVLENNTEFLT